ncbi:hypothetical protein ACWEN6_11540 [Sphaerisporangium sp. NPDC004334]
MTLLLRRLALVVPLLLLPLDATASHGSTARHAHSPSATAPSPSATAPFPATSAHGPEACAHAGTADFNGDGFNDVVVGDPFGEPPDRWAGWGHLFLLSGTSRGFPDVVGRPFPSGGGLSGWTARAGHLDGDGCLDLVVASPHWNGYVTDKSSNQATLVPGAGTVTVYWGGPDFGRPGAARLDLHAPSPRNEAHFGWSLAVASGLLAVGAPYEDADGVPDSGAVYLYRFGGDRGRVPGDPRRITQQTPGVPGDGEAGDLFGWSVALGALAKGPAPDLAVGAPYEDTPLDGRTVRDSGAVTVLYDAAEGPGGWYRGKGWDLSKLTDQVPVNEGDLFGYSLAYGDAVGRLAAGAPYADPLGARDAGIVQIFSGARTAPEPVPAWTFWQGNVGEISEPRDAFGFSLAFSGGRDLVVGAPFDGDGTHPETGAVHVLTLTPAGTAFGPTPSTEPPLAQPARLVRSRGPQSFEHFGWSVSGAGEGWVIVGAPDRDGAGAIGLVRMGGMDAEPLRPGDGHILPFDRTHHPTDFGATVAG